MDERSPEYPAVANENSEIEGEVLLNDYKKKTARNRKKISPVNYLIESESDDEREKISNLVEYICGSDEVQDNALEIFPSIYEASFKTKDKVLNILPSLFEVKETSQTLRHVIKITMKQQKLSQLNTPKKEKQKLPPQLSQTFKGSMSLSSPQIAIETIKVQDKEAEDSPSIHEVKQIKQQNKIANEIQNTSQLIAPNNAKQKSPLQLSQAFESSISSPQIVMTFPEKKQSSITKVFETFRIQGEKVLRDSPSVYEMNQSQQQNKITMEQQKSTQLITPKKEKQKSPSQLIQSSESPISSSLPQITAFTEKKPLYISKVFETYTIQDKEIEDSPSVHEMKQTQHLNEITTEHQKLSQMIAPNKEKQKSPLQLSQTSKNPISSTPPQVVTAFPEKKQSRFPQIFEALSEQQDFHPEGHAVTPINDSGIAAENSLSVIETDEETELRSEISGGQTVGKNKNEDSQKYKKPQRI